MPKTRPAVLEERAEVSQMLGRRLAAAREATGLSQLAVARALGVPQSRIAKLELGIRHLQFTEGLRLADLYSLSPSDLDPDVPR